MGTEKDTLVDRAIALIIDTVIVSVVTVVLFFVVFAIGAAGGRAGLGIALLLTPIIGLLGLAYFVYFEGSRGQTVGKMFMDIVVVKEDGSPIGYGEAAIRNVLRIVDGIGPIPYTVGLIVWYVNEKGQRVGDILANTVVVEK